MNLKQLNKFLMKLLLIVMKKVKFKLNNGKVNFYYYVYKFRKNSRIGNK